jgi:uncharacterized Tic20 family protein
LLCRHFKANGINPIFALSILLFAFIFFSVHLLDQSAYALYLYAFFPFTFLATLGAQKRNEFLQITFPKKKLQQLRMAENALIVCPFAIMLIFKHKPILSLAILILACLFSFYVIRTRKSTTMPTLFFKSPFEYTIGFRKTFLGIIICYILLIIGSYIGNFNLALVAMGLLFLIMTSYYTLPENEFYVWVFSKSSPAFLHSKIKIALNYSLYLSVPALLSLLIIFPSHYLIIFGIFVAGLFIVITSLLGKYALYPSEVNLIQILCIIFGALFPPLMLIVIPILYLTSINRLKPILE